MTTAAPRQPCCCSPNTGPRRGSADRPARLHAWLKKNGTRSSAAVAQAAVEAAMSQHTTVLAQQVGELIVAALAQEIITLDKELAELDRPDQR